MMEVEHAVLVPPYVVGAVDMVPVFEVEASVDLLGQSFDDAVSLGHECPHLSQ